MYPLDMHIIHKSVTVLSYSLTAACTHVSTFSCFHNHKNVGNYFLFKNFSLDIVALKSFSKADIVFDFQSVFFFSIRHAFDTYLVDVNFYRKPL